MPVRTASAVMTDTAALTNIWGEKDLKASSNANIMPVTGALKATAKPAEAPAAIWRRRIIKERLSTLPVPSPTQPPISMDGPSLPAARPRNTQASDAANMEQSVKYQLKGNLPRQAPSIWGMPLPRIIGTNFTSVPIATAPAARPISNRGMNAGYCRSKSYSPREYSSPRLVHMV